MHPLRAGNVKRCCCQLPGQNQAGCARRLATASPHSNDFMHGRRFLFVSWNEARLHFALGFAASLGLGATSCAPHTCIDSSGVHGLACRKFTSRHVPLTPLTIKRALASVYVSSKLKPNSRSRDDGKQTYGVNLLLWVNGHWMIWDLIRPYTLAASHLNQVKPCTVVPRRTASVDFNGSTRHRHFSDCSCWQCVSLLRHSLTLLTNYFSID